MRNTVKDWGTVNITLKKYMQDNHISKNQLCKKANMQYTQFQAYYNNTIKRIDRV